VLGSEVVIVVAVDPITVVPVAPAPVNKLTVAEFKFPPAFPIFKESTLKVEMLTGSTITKVAISLALAAKLTTCGVVL
jgi:hypothetical protein